MKTIIAATDFSEAAGKAVAFAAEMARHFNAKLILFNAFHLPIPTGHAPIPVPDVQDLIRENKEQLEHLAKKTGQRYGIEAESATSTSLEGDGLKKLFFQKQADLVVMGMRGSSFSRKLFGSLTTSFLREGGLPILVVPENAHFREMKKILFACDSHKLTLDTKLSLLKELAFAFNARVQILQVVKEEKELALAGSSKQKEPLVVPNLESIFRGIKHTYRQMEDDDVVEGIEKGILEYEAGLLVMVPHKAGFWDSVFNSSNTRKMALRTRIPLLALPNTGHS